MITKMKVTPRRKYIKETLTPGKVFGVGINDADYVVYPTINGKRVACPFYFTWKSMLQRCYHKKFHKRYPTYIGCTVCEEWYVFSKFKKWMQSQDWEGNQLDKDLLVPGNKVYGPDTCLFITAQVNTLIKEFANPEEITDYKPGVSLHHLYKFTDKDTYGKKKWLSRIKKYGETQYLGIYYTEEEAHLVFRKERKKYIKEVADKQRPIVKEALYNIADNL